MTTSSIYLKQSCIKTLSPVEAERNRSHQHEFNGVNQLKQIFGLERITTDATFTIRGTDISLTDTITWYDARENSLNRTEYRLYFKDNYVMDQARAGDNIIVGIDKNDKINIILIQQNTADYEGNIPSWR